MAVQKGSIKEKIDLVQSLALEQRQRLTKLLDALKKVPDVSGEQTRLKDALADWNNALNRVNPFQLPLHLYLLLLQIIRISCLYSNDLIWCH